MGNLGTHQNVMMEEKQKKVPEAEIKKLKEALLEKTLELEKEKVRSENLSCKVDSLHLHGQLRI